MSDFSVKMFQAPPTIGKIPDGRRLAWYFLEPVYSLTFPEKVTYPMYPSSLPDPGWRIDRDFMALVPSWMILI